MSSTAPSPTDSSREALSTSRVFLYALPNIPHSLALLPVINYIPSFYASEMGMPLAMVGLMLVLSRAADILIDPFIGAWSDRTRTRLGRRKPWILFGLPVLMLATWMVFVPPAQAGLGYLFVGLFLMYLGFTLVDLPYTAWGNELSSDYDERSRVAGWRGGFNSVGSLITLAIPVALQAAGHIDTATTLLWMALFFVVFQPLCFALAMWKVPERQGHELPAPQRHSLWAQLGTVRRNGPFIQLLTATFLLIVGLAVGATLNKIFATHVVQAPEVFAWMIFLQNLVLLAALPLWLRLARTIGKHRAMAVAVLMMGALNAVNIFWGPGDGWAFAGTVIALGAPLGAAMFLGASMVADLVDKDLLDSGNERNGLYVAFMSVATKAAVVFGVLVGTAIPGLAGFQPSQAEHSASSMLVLRLVYAFACPLLALPAAWLLWRYPLTRETQQLLRQRIDALRRGSAAAH